MVQSAETKSMGQPWLQGALVAALLYPAIGVGFAFLDSPYGVRFWRLAAWVASAVVLVGHVIYEQRRHSPPPRTAWHVSFAVALGALVLAVWVLAFGYVVGARRSSLAPFALLLFPLLSGVPAFVIALLLAGVGSKLRRGR
jgi:ABC-type transport system involved in cytochrome c biogenesis permease subunit